MEEALALSEQEREELVSALSSSLEPVELNPEWSSEKLDAAAAYLERERPGYTALFLNAYEEKLRSWRVSRQGLRPCGSRRDMTSSTGQFRAHSPPDGLRELTQWWS